MTDATLYTIQSRFRPFEADPARVDHFTLDEGTPASSQIIVDESGWTPYCLDHPNRRVIFVELPQEVDLSRAVFIYLPQFEQSKRVLAVPYESLEGLAARVPPPSKIVFVMSMMRSGTTLVSHMFNHISDAWSLSEPDVFMNLAQMRGSIDPAETVTLIKHLTRLLYRPIAGCAATTLVLKFRSQSLFDVGAIFEAFPDQKYLFLYRDGVSWANSVYHFLQLIGIAIDRTDDEEVNRLSWRMGSSGSDVAYLEDLTGRSVSDIHHAEISAALYALQIETYLKSFAAGVPYCAIRYNELNSDRENQVAHMLDYCEMPAAALPDLMQSFDEDSQGGTALGRDHAVKSMTADEVALFKTTLARHPRFNSPDILLPDVYHRDRLS